MMEAVDLAEFCSAQESMSSPVCESGPMQSTNSQCMYCFETHLLSEMFNVCANGHDYCKKCIEEMRQEEDSCCPGCDERLGEKAAYKQETVNGQHCVYATMRSAVGSREVVNPFVPCFVDQAVLWPYEKRGSVLESLCYEPYVDLRKFLSFNVTITGEFEYRSGRNGSCEAVVVVRKGTLVPSTVCRHGLIKPNVAFKFDGDPAVFPFVLGFDEGQHRFLPMAYHQTDFSKTGPTLAHITHGLRTIMHILDFPLDDVNP